MGKQIAATPSMHATAPPGMPNNATSESPARPVAEDEEKLRYGEADHYQRGRERVCSYNNCIEIISYGNSKV